ncbi:unnamed protein product, partial [marine sediment metagenome]
MAHTEAMPLKTQALSPSSAQASFSQVLPLGKVISKLPPITIAPSPIVGEPM